MGKYVAENVVKKLIAADISVKGAKIAILGFTFKENCPDCRNTKVADIVKALNEYNLNIDIYDPWASPAIAKHEYDIDITNELPTSKYDAVILAVSHKEFAELDVKAYGKENHVIFDVKGFLDKEMVDGRL